MSEELPSAILNTLIVDPNHRDVLMARLANKSGVIQANGCIPWTGPCSIKRYGQLCYKGKKFQAHRVALVLSIGPVASDLETCHSCDNPNCVNPSHLFPGSRKENALDAASKGRLVSQSRKDLLARGTRNGAAKLNESIVREMRQRFANGERYTEIARYFGVSRFTTRKAVLGVFWGHVQ